MSHHSQNKEEFIKKFPNTEAMLAVFLIQGNLDNFNYTDILENNFHLEDYQDYLNDKDEILKLNPFPDEIIGDLLNITLPNQHDTRSYQEFLSDIYDIIEHLINTR